MRSFSREEHVWLTSDFFQKIRENFKQGLFVLITDIAVLFLGSNAMIFYSSLYKSGYQIGLYIMSIVVIFMMIYTFMHFYLYQFIITFDLKFRDILKNSVIMSIASLPMNICLTVFVIIISFFAMTMLSPIGIILISVLCWMSFMRFPIDFYVSRIIKRKLIDTQDTEESED